MPNALAEHAHRELDGMEREHALELQLVRALQNALGSGDRCAVLELMGQLEDFANAHFQAEQLMMRLHAYPGYAAHEIQHDRLTAELRQLSTAILSDSEHHVADHVQALERWMVDHIASEDAALVAFLRRPAAAEPA
jgi:hemerythrin-like metal-binding protein